MTDSDTGRPVAEDARADWQARIGRRRMDAPSDVDPSVDAAPPAGVLLSAPSGVTATPGRGQVTVDWEPVPGAIGYQVHRADDGDVAFTPLDHRGGDVLAVPHPPYADTTGQPGYTYRYAVSALSTVDIHGPLGDPVRAAATHIASEDPVVDVHVRADESAGPLPRPWRPMIGSEHLSHLLCTDTTGGRPVGSELEEALRLARDELSVGAVRAHAILCDDLAVYREVDGVARYNFDGIDAVYDRVLALGLRPVVELSFMPRDLARDPTRTVFAYGAIISPPRDWARWADLIRAVVAHLIERYGRDEVRHWLFEVWNEANLEVFWSGTREEFWTLYDVTAAAIKDVDPGLRVGGPATAAAGWVDDFLAHAKSSGSTVDFLTTHTYGSPPLDFRPACASYGRPDLPILWTEWGVTPTHFNPVSDGVFAAAFLLRGMLSAAGRIESLSYWVASDHFEELGRPPALFHGGFGLLTVGNLRKPRFWALSLLNRLGDEAVPVALAGDGAESLVQAVAARHGNGRIGVLVWNGTLDQSKADGDPLLTRTVRMRLTGLPEDRYRLTHLRIDANHSDIVRKWRELGGGDWPDAEQWAALSERDTLDKYEPDRALTVVDGVAQIAFSLPMPGVSYLDLDPTE